MGDMMWKRRGRHVRGRGSGWEAANLPQETPARQKIVSSYVRASREQPPREEVVEISALRRTPHPKGYQALEDTQQPKPTFPDTLACFVLVFITDNEWQSELANPEGDPGASKGPSYAKMNMQPLVDKLRSADMIVREMPSWDNQFMYCLVSISEKRQRQVAAIMEKRGLLKLRLKKQDDEGMYIKYQGGWAGFKQHLSEIYERSTEGSLFSSAQQCLIIEFLLNDVDEHAMGPQLVQKEACEPGNTVLQQLQKDGRIITYFCMHHKKKLAWLKKWWVDNFMGKQPIEDIREYFGAELTLFFAFLGYMVKMLWVPSAVGLMVFLTEIVVTAQYGTAENPFLPLYAIFIALWSIMFSAGWHRLQSTFQLEWDTEDLEPSEDYRTDFVQYPRTYKRLNLISHKEEYFPDPLWRFIALVASFFAVLLFIALNIVAVLSVEVLKSLIHQALGEGVWILIKIVGAMLQACVIMIFKFLSTELFKRLNNFENWKTEWEYHTAMVAKRMSFGFVNSYFAIFFVSFMANSVPILGVDVSCPEHHCIDYCELMLAVIFLQQSFYRYYANSVWPTQEKRTKEAEWEEKFKKKQEAEGNTRRVEIEDHEHQREAKVFENFDAEYADKLLEYGYVAMFGASFPLLALACLISTMLELRAHARTLTEVMQRPKYRTAKDIGQWGIVLDVFATSAIISQALFLAITSTSLGYYFPNMTKLEGVFYGIVVEHALLLFKVLFESRVAAVPHEVQIAAAKRNYERDVLIAELDTQEFNTALPFFTSDTGQLYYGKQGDADDEKKGDKKGEKKA